MFHVEPDRQIPDPQESMARTWDRFHGRSKVIPFTHSRSAKSRAVIFSEDDT